MSESKTNFFAQDSNETGCHQILAEIAVCGESVHYLLEAKSVQDVIQIYKNTDKPFINMPGIKVAFDKAIGIEQSDKIYAFIFIDVDKDLLEIHKTNYTSESDRHTLNDDASYVSQYTLSDYLSMH